MNAERSWPAEKVERWPIERLKPYPRNPVHHDADQIDRIAASMDEFGWTMPILADDDGVVIAGHARILAVRKRGFGEVPVIVARGWSEAQKQAYRIADNQLANKDDVELPLEQIGRIL